jgi:hypothetical protein
MNSTINVLFIFLGAFLTFLGTWVIEGFKNYKDKKERSQSFSLFLKLQLQSISKTLERLRVSLEKNNFYEFLSIKSLQVGVKELSGSRKDAVYLNSQSQQEKYFDLISDLDLYSVELENFEGFLGSQEKLIGTQGALFSTRVEFDAYCSRKRTEKLVELIEFKRKSEEFVKALDR